MHLCLERVQGTFLCIQVAKLKFVCGGGFVFDLDLAWMDLETDSIMLPFISGQYATHATVVINGATMPGFAKKKIGFAWAKNLSSLH